MSDNITTSPKPSSGTDRIEEIQYYLEPEDYVVFMRFQTRRNPAAVWKELGTYSRFVALLLGSIVLPLLDPTPIGFYAFIGLIILLPLLGQSVLVIILDLLLITGMMPRRFFRGRVDANYKAGLFKRDRRLHVWMTADEFVEMTEFHQDDGDGVVVLERTESRALWSAVESIDEANEHFFFKMAEKGCLIVPKRIFPDEEAVRLYRETVEALRSTYLRRLETPFAAAEGSAPGDIQRETINGPG